MEVSEKTERFIPSKFTLCPVKRESERRTIFCIPNYRHSVADPVGFDEVCSNPPFLVRWRPFTTSLAVLFSPPWLNIARYLFAIHSKRIARYPLVSVDQVRFCGELLFFFLIFFLFFLFFFFFFLLPIFKSWDGFSPPT